MAKFLITAVLCFTGISAFSDEPESPGIPANCEISASTMEQRQIRNGERILTEKKVTLHNLSFTSIAPGVDFKTESIELTGGGFRIDGEHFGSDSKDIWIDATVKSEVLSGRVTLDRVRVFRKLEGRVRKFDCKLIVKDSTAKPGEESPDPEIAK